MCLTLEPSGYSFRVPPVDFASCDFSFTPFFFYLSFFDRFVHACSCLFDVIFLVLFICLVLVTFVYKLFDRPIASYPLLVLHCPSVLVLGHISRC